MPTPHTVRITTLPLTEALAAMSRPIATVDPIPLPDGEYQSLRYDYVLEIDGVGYATVERVPLTRDEVKGSNTISITEGRASVKSRSISELAGAKQHKWWPDSDPMGSGGARKVCKTAQQ